MNLASWKHWATIIGAAAIGGFATAFVQSGNVITTVALEHDVLVGLGMAAAALVGIVQPNAAQAGK